jgi:ABC-type dipeptide/oligopeptide/nickel transport system permease component
MLRYVSMRFLYFIPTLLAITLLTFGLGYFGPGDPVRILMGERWQNEAEYLQIKHSLGLDRPFLTQYADFMSKLARGDFGMSLVQKQRTINQLIKDKLPVSLQLGLVAAILLVIVGVTLGVLAGYKQNTWLDYSAVSVAVFLHAVPPYAMAPILLTIFVLKLRLVPVGYGWHGIFSSGLIIPVFLLMAGPLAYLLRQTRAGVLEVLQQEYVRTARAKGLSERAVLLKHVLKNALTPALTTMGLVFSNLLIGSVFVEEIFGVPGFGNLIVSSVRSRDYPVLIATTTIAAILIMVVNLLTDLAYGILDPRARLNR